MMSASYTANVCEEKSNQPGEYKGENLDKGDEYSTANVGEKERKDVSSKSSPKHRHTTVHIDCPLGMEILNSRIIGLLDGTHIKKGKCEGYLCHRQDKETKQVKMCHQW